MSLNIADLAENLENSVHSQLTVRRAGELKIEEWSTSEVCFQSYIETIMGIIRNERFGETVKISAAIAMKNHVTKNWKNYTPSLKSTCKETVVQLLLAEETDRIVSNQLLEIVRVISKDDFPYDWLDELKIRIDANEVGVLQIFHAMFKKFRYELATYRLWEEVERSTVMANLLTDLLKRFTFTSDRANGNYFQKLLFTVNIIHSLSFHDLPEELYKQLPLIMNVFCIILCLPASDNKKIGLIEKLQSSACLAFAHFADRYTKEVDPYAVRFMTRLLMLKSKIEQSSLTKYIVLKHTICQVESVIQKRKLCAAQTALDSIPQMSAITLEKVPKLEQLAMNLPEDRKCLTKKVFSNFSLESNLVKSLNEMGLDRVTKSQDQLLSHLLQTGQIERHLALIVVPGEGSSLALCITLLTKVKAETCLTQALYVAETLHSAMHTYKTLSRLARYTDIAVQLAPHNKDQPCHILVCTTKHLIELPSDLSQIMYLVFDDADNTIRSWDSLKKLLLRVSLGHELIALSASPNKNWLKTVPTADKLTVSNIKSKKSKHHYVKCANITEKLYFIVKMCKAIQSGSAKALVFCRTSSLDLVVETLHKHGIFACVSNADMDSSQRLLEVEDFTTKPYYTAMCSTNGLSKGLALPGVKIVINFDFPAQHVFYFFRSSRVELLGNEGQILSFVDQEEESSLKKTAEKLKIIINEIE